jgi:hypothetical protein
MTTAPRGGGDEPPPSSAANDPATPTSAHVSGLNRRGSRGAAMATFSMEVFDNEVVPSTLNSIAPILRVAAEIEHERPRVAYLCKSNHDNPVSPYVSILRDFGWYSLPHLVGVTNENRHLVMI